MKIEIDLDNIFRDEEGGDESLEDSVRRQVIEKLSGDMRKRLFARIDSEVNEIMSKQISQAMTDHMPSLINDIMNVTYTPVSSYGSRGEPTTFRDELVKAVSANMIYAPKQYEREENAFTRAVRTILAAKTQAVEKAIVDQVDTKFKEDAIKFAVTKLSERLGIK